MEDFKAARKEAEKEAKEINQAYEKAGKQQRVVVNPETLKIDTIVNK